MTKKLLLIINDAPYGTERPYNGLRIGLALLKESSVILKVFLIGDGVFCGIRGQNTPQGNYNIEQMLKTIVLEGAVAT